MTLALPRAVTLPSGRRVHLERLAAIERGAEGPLGLGTIERALRLRDAKTDTAVDVRTLPLGDFHLLRALCMRSEILDEDEVTVTCRNCEAAITLKPCALLEIGPWIDDELGDDELDATLPFGEPIRVPAIPLGRVRSASSVTFRARTVAEALPLLEALDAVPTPVIVEAMGIVALGKEKSPAVIADALADEVAFAPVANAFLASHYPPRLAAIAFCASCKGRNEVDAPYVREFERSQLEAATDEAFPDFDAFDARVRAIAAPMLRDAPGTVDLVVDGAEPAVDDGGEPLWGCYQPRVGDGFGGVTAEATITLFHRTFEAVWREEGPYDWEDEVAETVEHELEHHVNALRGDDPKDDEEHAAIDAEHARIVGKKETRRREIEGFAGGLSDFVVRAWPLLAIGFLALVIWLLSQRD